MTTTVMLKSDIVLIKTVLASVSVSVSRRSATGVSDTVRLWLFSVAAAPTWAAERRRTEQLPLVSTRIYPAGSPADSMVSAWRCAAIVLKEC